MPFRPGDLIVIDEVNGQLEFVRNQYADNHRQSFQLIGSVSKGVSLSRFASFYFHADMFKKLQLLNKLKLQLRFMSLMSSSSSQSIGNISAILFAAAEERSAAATFAARLTPAVAAVRKTAAAMAAKDENLTTKTQRKSRKASVKNYRTSERNKSSSNPV